MSKYCGKCDLWDSLAMIDGVNDKTTDWDKIKIYRITEHSHFNENGWNDVELLDIKSLKDLLPYAAYLVSMAMCQNEDRLIYISSESYVTRMEQERIGWAVGEVRRVYRKCKRQKKEFDAEALNGEIWGATLLHSEIAKRMKEHPTSFKTDGLKVPMCEFYKTELYDDMMKMGYSENEAREWCYHNRKTW